MEAWMGGLELDYTQLHFQLERSQNSGGDPQREEVVFNNLKGRMVFYFMDNESTYNILKKGSSKTLSLHILVQQLVTRFGVPPLEIIHIPGTTIIAQGTDSLRRGIWANGLNTDFKSFAIEVLLPTLPYVSLTKWVISHIGILEGYAPFWNVEMDTSSWEPHNLMHTTFSGCSHLESPDKGLLLPSWPGWNPHGKVPTCS
jgi:hypothetical protein